MIHFPDKCKARVYLFFQGKQRQNKDSFKMKAKLCGLGHKGHEVFSLQECRWPYARVLWFVLRMGVYVRACLCMHAYTHAVHIEHQEWRLQNHGLHLKLERNLARDQTS